MDNESLHLFEQYNYALLYISHIVPPLFFYTDAQISSINMFYLNMIVKPLTAGAHIFGFLFYISKLSTIF